MPDLTSQPQNITVSVTAPYEAAIIESLRLIEKIIDSQPKDVQARIWEQHMAFWTPAINLANVVNTKVVSAIEGLFNK